MKMDKLNVARLYQNSMITEAGVLNAITKGWITIDEAVEIIGADNALETVRSAKLMEISKACNETIVAGIEVPVQGRTDHFNLSLEDQSNINNLFRVVELGGTEFPYQADDGTCLVYSAMEIASIYIAAQTMITTQTAYHNALKAYVNALESADDIAAVRYGMELPQPYVSELAGKLAIAKEQMEAIMKRLGGAA